MQNSGQMDTLTAFGLFAVAAMLVAYALEERNRGFIVAFAGSCAPRAHRVDCYADARRAAEL